jgi:hypothetical protein
MTSAKARSSVAPRKPRKAAIKANSSYESESQLLERYGKEAQVLFGKTAIASLNLGLFLRKVREELTERGGGKLWRKFASDPKCCPVSYSQASKLITIAEAEHLKDYVELLPSARESVYEIATLPRDAAKEYFEKGRITPHTPLRDIKLLKSGAVSGAKNVNTIAVQNIASALARQYEVAIGIESALGEQHLEKELTKLINKLPVTKLTKIEIQ